MNNTDNDLGKLTSMVSDRDEIDSHISNRRAKIMIFCAPAALRGKVTKYKLSQEGCGYSRN